MADPDRLERIAKGVALIQAGRSYTEAQSIAGVPATTIRRAVAQTGVEVEERAERIAARAAELAERGVERMHREIDDTDPKHVAAWTHTAAKLAGLLDRDSGQAVSDVGELLGRLTAGGNTVTVGVKVERSQPQAIDVSATSGDEQG